MGTFNLHASLLPQYRGAAPINWAVMNGDTETGITTFFLQHEIDTGKVIQQEKVAIAETDNVGIVHDKLMELGGKLVIETVDAILENRIKPIAQEDMVQQTELRAAPKIFKETCRINWEDNTQQIYNFIRGLSPYPAAWTELHNEDDAPLMMKIYETEKIEECHNEKIGTMKTDDKSYLHIAVKDGYISIKSLQLAGKKRLPITDFLRGFKLLSSMTVN